MRNMTIVLGAVAALGLGTAAQAATNLVVNGSFDADTTATKVRFENNVSGWTGGAKLTFLAPAGTADNGSYLSIYGPFPATSPDGGNFILADGDPGYSDAFSQTISGLTVGNSYELNFYQAAGQQLGFTGATTERWKVTFGGETKLSTMYSLPEGAFGDWTAQKMRFTATSASQVLTFLAVGTPNGAPPISLLDGVSLSAVPEPTTWAMLIAGFGLVGAAARRRRNTAVAA